jgi:hypothetical protein
MTAGRQYPIGELDAHGWSKDAVWRAAPVFALWLA